MANKKVITLGLDYSQLDAGTAEINRKMSLLEAQFKLNKEEIKAYGDESDQLNLKQDKLTQQIILQTKKVENAKEAYDKALASGKASDKQLDSLQKNYITNQTSLQKLNNELQENKTKIDNANKSSASFGDSIRGMASSLGINVSPAVEALATKFDGLDKNMGMAVLTIGTVITAFAGATINLAHTADELLELSSKTGLSTDALQEMQYAADFLDVSTEDMTGSITKLIRNMNDARGGSKELDEAFRKLHVRYKDGNGVLLDSQQVFLKSIDALGKVKNETERDALAMTIFGKSARELNPLIEAGSQKLRDLGIEAKKMGVVMGKDTLEDAAAFQDSLDNLNKAMEGVWLQLGTTLLPVMQAFASLISGISTPVLTGIIVFAALSAVLLSLSKVVTSFTTAQALMAAANVAVGETGAIATAGMAPLLLILLAIIAAIAIIVGGTVAIGKAMRDAQEAGENAISGAAASANALRNSQSNVYNSVGHANGTKDAMGGWAWTGEAGPELQYTPPGSRIYSNSDSMEMLKGGDIYNITIPARDIQEFNDIIRIAKSYKQVSRQGVVKRG